jgi:hypothetical protein
VASLTEATADRLDPAQATDLARVIDAQAEWECLLADGGSGAALRVRQKAYDAYRSGLARYAARYGDSRVRETALTDPGRLAEWCRVVRAVFRRAEGVCPSHAVEKAARMADRIATRVGTEPVRRGPAADLPAAVLELGVLIAWCGGLAGPRRGHHRG